MENFFASLIDNGTAIAVLGYLLYRDNKFMNEMLKTMTRMQAEIEDIMKLLEKNRREK